MRIELGVETGSRMVPSYAVHAGAIGLATNGLTAKMAFRTVRRDLGTSFIIFLAKVVSVAQPFFRSVLFIFTSSRCSMSRQSIKAALQAALACSVFASLSGCSSIPAPEATVGLGEALQRLAEKHGVCGVAVAIIKAGAVERIETASGCPSGSPAKADSVFQVASLSKPVFAYAVIKLAEQGKIDLDARVMQYLPHGYFHRPYPFLANDAAKAYAVTDPQLDAVTVRMLLNHTSGLPNWTDGTLHFDFPPGKGWEYSGEGYVLLQRAVEAITHTPLDVLMNSIVFKPLAMNRSSYIWRDEFDRYFQRGPNALSFSEPIAPATLYSSAADYGRFLAAVVSDKNLIKTTLASSVVADAGLGLNWGLGWGIEKSGGKNWIFQWGNNPGYRAFAIASVESGDGLVILTDSENGMALAEPITNRVLPGEHRVFKFHMLQEGVAGMICGALGICL